MDESIYRFQMPENVPGETLEFSLPIDRKNSPNTTELNANHCPPLWWIVIEGSSSRSYWNTVGRALQNVVAKLPNYVHIGLAVASEHTLSVWNLQSPVPFVRHHHNFKSNQYPEVIFADVRTYQSHLQTALRAMADSVVNTEGNLSILQTVEVLLNQLLREGRAVGLSSSSSGRLYAGSRILMVLNRPPKEFKATMNPVSNGRFGGGGQGGACFEPGSRFVTDNSSGLPSEIPNLTDSDPEMGASDKKIVTPEHNTVGPDDFTSSNLKKKYPKVSKTLLHNIEQLGRSCAGAALGVDILFCTEEPSPMFGIPFLKLLCEKTGAPGPILFDVSKNGVASDLEQEIQARLPTFFGGLLKVRLSPGFKIDTNPVAQNGLSLDIGSFYVDKGIMGSGASTEQEALWQLGVCDAKQSMTLDMEVTNKIQRSMFVDGVGEVALKPCIQASFEYTAVVPRRNEKDEFVTVRRLRICTLHMPMATSVEDLYAAIDLEALSIVLMHKLNISAFSESLSEAQEIGKDWLKDVMVCAYRSANNTHKLDQHRVKDGHSQQMQQDDLFHASSRLLNVSGGELTEDEILLGQGHKNLRHIPRIVWCILNCDALRPSSSQYQPSLDARCASLSQMSTMTPSVFARCIFPRVELWQSGNESNEAIESGLGLSLESLALHVMEQRQIDPQLIIFVDSPHGILVCDSRHLVSSEGDGVEIGDALQNAIRSAIERYRTPPHVTIALDLSSSVDLTDYMIEDSLNEFHQNFSKWKAGVAVAISNDLEESSE